MAFSLEKACKQLIIKSPYYGLFLLNLDKKITSENNPTLCVGRKGINVELRVNPDFWDSLTDDEALGVLTHEILHICFGHITESFNFPQHERGNIAADLEVNGYIPILPKGGLHATDYGWEDKKGSHWYYDHLPDMPDNPNGPGGNGNGNGDPTNGNGNDQNSQGKGPRNHDSWKEFGDLSDAEKQLVEAQINNAMVRTADQVEKLQGSVPGELAGKIEKLREKKPSVFNWKAYFRRALGFIYDVNVKKSRKKESTRFPGSAGLRHKKKTKILVMVDTSGSVSDRELNEFFGEINYIYKAGAAIDIAEVDAKLNRVYEYTGKWDGTISGRGGKVVPPYTVMYR